MGGDKTSRDFLSMLDALNSISTTAAVLLKETGSVHAEASPLVQMGLQSMVDFYLDPASPRAEKGRALLILSRIHEEGVFEAEKADDPRLRLLTAISDATRETTGANVVSLQSALTDLPDSAQAILNPRLRRRFGGHQYG